VVLAGISGLMGATGGPLWLKLPEVYQEERGGVTNGSIDIFASDATNLLIDINGYFAPMDTGGLSLYGVTPCRVVDTCKPAGSPAITSLDVGVSASACGIPANAQAHGR
jgi:hypothetical protein